MHQAQLRDKSNLPMTLGAAGHRGVSDRGHVLGRQRPRA